MEYKDYYGNGENVPERRFNWGKFTTSLLLVVILLGTGFVGGIIYQGYMQDSLLTSQQQQMLDYAQQLVQEQAINEHTSEEALDSMLKGLASGLDDPYAYYFTKEELAEYNDAKNGVVQGGIGVQVVKEEGLPILITDVYEGQPADIAGIKKLDRIVEVDGTDVQEYTLEQLVEIVTGEPGTTVSITVERDGQQLSFNITRGVVQQKLTTYRIIEQNIMYIRIVSFHGNAVDYFEEAIKKATDSGCKGIIIDLRNNPGGDLDVFEKIADIILPAGETFSAKNRSGEKIQTCESDASSVNLPLAVLINGDSASASEAFAGAVRDFNAGVLVGTKSYGKGTMQITYPMSNGGAFKLTVAKYYLPGGECIDGTGITPDVVVELPQELQDKYYMITDETDTQLQRAIQEVQAKIG